VPHLHVHVLGGRPMAWPPGWVIFVAKNIGKGAHMCAFFIFNTNDQINLKCWLKVVNKTNSSLFPICRAPISTFL
jgi:hypothetical protein